MNILLINHYAGSQQHGMEYRPFYLAREWQRAGHHVTTVAASFSHLRSKNPQLLKPSIQQEVVDGIQYIWLKTPEYSGNGARRALNIFAFVAQLLRHQNFIRTESKSDIVIASSTYPFDMYAAYWIAQKTNAMLIFEVHDLWPLTLIELGGMSPKHPFIWLMQRAENFAYKTADLVVSILPKAKEHMQAHGMMPEKFYHLPNGIDTDEWQNQENSLPATHQEVIDRLKSAGYFLVGYAGSHGNANALTHLVDAAHNLIDLPVSFVLIGQGHKKAELQAQAQVMGLQNVFFLPSLSRTKVPCFMSNMDALLMSLSKHSLFRFGVSPNKLMDYMMSGKPIIYSVEAGNNLVAEADCGISIPAEDSPAIAAAIKQLMDMSAEERLTMGRRGRKFVMENQDYRVLAERFIQIIKDHADSAHAPD